MPLTEQVGSVCGDIIAAPPWKCLWAWHWPVVGMLPWGEGLQVSRQNPTCPHTGHLWGVPRSVPKKGSTGSQHSPIPMELGHEGAEEREARTRLFCFCACWLPVLVTHTCSQTYTYMCSHTPGHTITHSHTFTVIQSQTCSHTWSHSHTQLHTYSHRQCGHTQTYICSHGHSHTHTATHTDTCSHTHGHTVTHT